MKTEQERKVKQEPSDAGDKHKHKRKHDKVKVEIKRTQQPPSLQRFCRLSGLLAHCSPCHVRRRDWGCP